MISPIRIVTNEKHQDSTAPLLDVHFIPIAVFYILNRKREALFHITANNGDFES